MKRIVFDFDDTITRIKYPKLKKLVENIFGKGSYNQFRIYEKILYESPFFVPNNLEPRHFFIHNNKKILKYHPLEAFIPTFLTLAYFYSSDYEYSEKLLKELYFQFPVKLDKKFKKCLKEVAKRNYEVYIVSQSPEERIRKILDEHEINYENINIYPNTKKSKIYIDYDIKIPYLDVYGLPFATQRRDYLEILREIKPRIVVGDSFSLDLIGAIYLKAYENINIVPILINRDHNTRLYIIKRFLKDVGGARIENLNDLIKFL